MRVAIPSDDGDLFAQHTGRCRGFIVYDCDGGDARRLEFRSNPMPGSKHSDGEDAGHDHQHHHDHGDLLQLLHDCQVLLARGMGPRLVMDLQRRGIEAVFCREESPDAAARAFASGSLEVSPESLCDHLESRRRH